MSTTPIVRRVDHVLIRADDPGPLFSLLTETFGLPVAWPLASYGFFASGGAFAGNIAIEVIRFGNPRPPLPTRHYGLAFEPHPLRESLDELARRGIPHGPPVPFVGDRPEGGRGTLWTNVTLGGRLWLGRRLGGNSRLNIALGRLISRLMRTRWSGGLLRRSLGDSLIFLTEYGFDAEAWREALRTELESRGGGALGVRAVDEVVVGVTDYEGEIARWQRLLDPVRPESPGAWRPGDGPAVRLVPDSQDRMKRLVFRASSLRDAADRLSGMGLLGDNSGQEVTVDPAKVEGLDIALH
jgi:hypothetical protein